MASRAQSELRAIDIKYLQQRLIETGNLPDEVYGHEDSVPMSAEAIAQAVQEAPDDYRAAAVVFLHLHGDQALPLLRKAYTASEGDRRIAYAQKLAMLGDDSGTELLIQRVRAAQAWDQGWNYRGMGQWGNAFSPLDTDMVALGMSGDRKAVPAILKMADLLDAEADFSHHRAVAMAVWLIAPRTYLGEDLCGTLRLWLDDQEPADGEWTQRLGTGSQHPDRRPR